MCTFKLTRTDSGREVDGYNLQWETSPRFKTPPERDVAVTVHVQDEDLRPGDIATRLRALADEVEAGGLEA